MIVQKYFHGLLILLCFLFVSVPAGGSTGSLATLKLAPDARSAALGESGLAGATGAMAVFHNPALLAFANNSQAAFAYTDWLLDLTLQSGAILFDYNRISVGLSFSVFTTPDIERRLLPADEPVETFDAHDLAAGISLGYSLCDNLAAGITMRYLYQQIYVAEASGVGLDLGVAWRFEPRRITLAAALSNIGEMGALEEEQSPLPTSVCFGAAGTILAGSEFGLRGQGEALYYLNDDIRLRAGLEGYWEDHFFLRGGYQSGSELRSFSGGAGIKWKIYTFDYAYQPLSEDFAASHRLTLSINF